MSLGGDLLALSAPPPLLILRALGLGDLLTAAPALRALQRAFPGRRRVLAAPAPLAPIAHAIDRALELVDLPAWVGGATRPDPAVADRLPHGAIAANLHGHGPHSHRLLLATEPARLVAFAHPAVPASAGGPRWDAHEHEVARWCRLLREHGIPADASQLDVAPPRGAGRGPGGPTLLHPGAAGPARRWPPERWAAVARGERERGRAVLVTGSPREAPLAARVAGEAGLPAAAVVAGRTDLQGLLALVASAGRVACGDTGIAHLATALRVPSVVVFGPTPPAAWGPPADRPWHRALWAGRAGDPHAACPGPGLLELRPIDVLAALSDLPEPSRRPATTAAAAA